MSKEISSEQKGQLLNTLQDRFKENMDRHENLEWREVQSRLEANPDALWSLREIEETGGEPDVIRQDVDTGEFIFYDCSPESPDGRRKVCYDKEGLESRKKYKPDNNAVDMAAKMGIELLTEAQYREIQELGDFDTKTSSWLKTPAEMRDLGGALFGDFRFGRTFIYHNGAQSYYGARGFRGCLRV